LKRDRSSSAATLGQKGSLQAAANERKADVSRIRERNRQRRLRYLLYLAIAVVGYWIWKAWNDQPLIRFPELTADSMIWLFPLAMILVISMALILPFVINGRNPAVRFSPEQITTRFEDVRGIDVVLEEVQRTLEIFLTYKTFKEELGGNPRRGILFEGRPGTGKTHLAKAMAAEAGVPFFFVSAPSFISMFQGASALRIRGFYKVLKKAARKEGGAIGFIEEIDAIGGRRGGMERSVEYKRSRMMEIDPFTQGGDSSSMVNELLIQMQSFDTPPFGQRVLHRLVDVVNLFMPATRQIKKTKPEYSNVLIIGATNRADALDPALMRPGRFDRALYFDLPSKIGRRELIDYFLERRAHDPEMDRDDLREELAGATLGYSPAMLEHIIDEAIVWALRDGRREFNWRDINRARLSEEIGLAQPVAYTDHEREIIATHEAGHAVAAYLSAKARKLEVLSIIKRRQALGLLAHSDTEERFTKTQSELESTLKITLGGMAAELIFFGESGTGPSSDLLAATTLAAQMVGSFGMGESLISYDAVDNGPHSAPNVVAKVLTNEDTKKEVDEMLRKQRDQVRYLLETNRDLVEALRDALLDREELLGDEIIHVLEEAKARRGPSASPHVN
jgi:cell division protease FtsH